MLRTMNVIAAAILIAQSPEVAAIAGRRLSSLRSVLNSTRLLVGCGEAPTYPHAKPKDYAHAMGTFFNATSKKREPVTFSAGDVIPFQCERGYTMDGSKDGSDVYDVECMEQGYYKPNGVCMKASLCGPVPNISHAMPTGKSSGGKVEFACNQGYSLDGEEVVAGGFGKNRFFELKCIEFSNSYEEFTGKCQAYAFVPATESIKLYNKVYEALFYVTCKGSLKTAFGHGAAPSGLDNICSKFSDSSAECQSLVTKIKADFESELQARAAHDSEKNASGQEWYEEKSPDRPGIGEEAHTFCTELWKLLEMPS